MSQTADAQPFKAEKRPIQVMLVDDSAVVRGMIRRYLDPKTDIEVVATSSNGEIAVATLKRNPDIDLIVLDIEMPVMDGLTAIPLLLEVKPDIKIVMASTLTERNADISLRALAAGATDYVAKPSSGAGLSTADDFKRELIEKIYSLAPTNRGEPFERTKICFPGAAASARPCCLAGWRGCQACSPGDRELDRGTTGSHSSSDGPGLNHRHSDFHYPTHAGNIHSPARKTSDP